MPAPPPSRSPQPLSPPTSPAAGVSGLCAGFIGLDSVGSRLATRLIRGGVALTVHASRPEAAASLRVAGANWAATPAELAAQTGIVFISAADVNGVDRILFGPEGVVEGAASGLLVVDLSIVPAERTRGFAIRLREQGIELIDAPVSDDAFDGDLDERAEGLSDGGAGASSAAEAGSPAIMAGGSVEAFERARPLLDLMGSPIVHVGDHGAGQVVRCCRQVITAVTIEAVAEALTLARRLGADPERVRTALSGGFAASRVLDRQGERMLTRDFQPGCRAALHGRDLGLVLDSAHALGLDLPATAVVAQQLNALVGAGQGEMDSAAMIQVLERMLGEQS